jgi:pilus assembly protein CpaE
LRAGVHHFIDMTAPVEEAHDVIYKLVTPIAAPAVAIQGTLISLLGSRPGVGCTTLSVHLADVLQLRKSAQHKDYQIGLLDLGLPAGDGQLYLNVAGTYSFIDTLQNRHRLDRTLIQTALTSSHNGIKVISLPRMLKEMVGISHEDVLSLLTQLRHYFDVLVLDLGGLSDMQLVEYMANASDQVLFVTDQSAGALVSLSNMLKEFNKKGGDASRRQLVLNRYDIRYGMSAQQIAERFNMTLAAVLPECTLRLMSSANQGKLLHEVNKHDPYVREIHDLSEKLLNPHAEKHAGKLSSWVSGLLKP